MKFSTLMAVGSAVIVGAISGCGDDDVLGVSADDLVGAWALVSSGGEPLPASITVDDCTFTILSEDLTFNDDATFAVTSVTSVACGDEDPEPDTESSTGTYRVSNGRLFLLFSGEAIETSIRVGVTSSRLTLTVVQNGQTSLIVYERATV